MNVAIIPARGGSKRIPRKNIKDFLGKPVIAYSIEAAVASDAFDKIIVSTDSCEIAEIAQEYGGEVPFVRPCEISGDFTSTADVILHALNWLSDQGMLPEFCCCVYATAPFVHPQYINQGLRLIKERKVSSVFSVTSFPFPILRALKIERDGHLAMQWPEHEMTRSNDLPEFYHDAGQFYWLHVKTFLEQKKMYGKDALPVILPRYIVQDIDTIEDWNTAEYLYEAVELSGKQ